MHTLRTTQLCQNTDPLYSIHPMRGVVHTSTLSLSPLSPSLHPPLCALHHCADTLITIPARATSEHYNRVSEYTRTLWAWYHCTGTCAVRAVHGYTDTHPRYEVSVLTHVCFLSPTWAHTCLPDLSTERPLCNSFVLSLISTL